MDAPVAPLGPTLIAEIDGHAIEFRFAAMLIEHATSISELDQWRIAIHTGSSDVAVMFDHFSGVGHRRLALPLQPDPLHVLAKIASDLALALALPEDKGEGVDYLYEGGYGMFVHHAWTLRHRLIEVKAKIASLLAGSGISLPAFALWAAEAYEKRAMAAATPGRPIQAARKAA